MIDLMREKRISLKEAAELCKVSLTTIYAWRKRQDRRLETAKQGGKRFTTVEALGRFTEHDEDLEVSRSVPMRAAKSDADRQLRELQEVQ